MRVAMAYEKPIPLPGLPPPEDTGEQLVADNPGAGGFDPGASGRLADETSDALGRLEERLNKAKQELPMKQAALGQGIGAASP
jgi:hypothetical protein